MKTIKPAWAMACATFLLASTVSAMGQPLRVDITGGEKKTIPIVVPDVLVGAAAPETQSQDLGTYLAAVIRADLESTGLFEILPAAPVSSRVAPLAAATYRASGAQILVSAAIRMNGEQALTYECAYIDVFSGQTEASSTITLDRSELRRAAHKCADIIFSNITGDPGHFDTRIAYIQREGPKTSGTLRLAIMDQDGAGIRAISNGASHVTTPAFSQDGQTLAYSVQDQSGAAIVVQSLRTGAVKRLDLPEGIPFGPAFIGTTGELLVTIARAGNSDIFRVDPSSNTVRALTDMPGTDTAPSPSPDGSLIIFESDRSGTSQLYVMNADGSNQRRITFSGSAYGAPAWSPQGNLIAFTQKTEAAFRIGIMRPDGSRERLLTDGWQDEAPSWAPSGRAIIFQRTLQGDLPSEFWTTDLTGTVRRKLTANRGLTQPSWSGLRP